MNKLNELTTMLANTPSVKRFKELESIIINDDKLQKEYKELIRLQKIMVQSKELKKSDYSITKNNYDTQKTKVLQYVIIQEYLDLQAEINDDLNMLQDIISYEISKDIDE